MTQRVNQPDFIMSEYNRSTLLEVWQAIEKDISTRASRKFTLVTIVSVEEGFKGIVVW